MAKFAGRQEPVGFGHFMMLPFPPAAGPGQARVRTLGRHHPLTCAPTPVVGRPALDNFSTCRALRCGLAHAHDRGLTRGTLAANPGVTIGRNRRRRHPHLAPRPREAPWRPLSNRANSPTPQGHARRRPQGRDRAVPHRSFERRQPRPRLPGLRADTTEMGILPRPFEDIRFACTTCWARSAVR